MIKGLEDQHIWRISAVVPAIECSTLLLSRAITLRSAVTGDLSFEELSVFITKQPSPSFHFQILMQQFWCTFFSRHVAL